jgi:hypothetical protein
MLMTSSWRSIWAGFVTGFVFAGVALFLENRDSWIEPDHANQELKQSLPKKFRKPASNPQLQKNKKTQQLKRAF